MNDLFILSVPAVILLIAVLLAVWDCYIKVPKTSEKQPNMNAPILQHGDLVRIDVEVCDFNYCNTFKTYYVDFVYKSDNCCIIDNFLFDSRFYTVLSQADGSYINRYSTGWTKVTIDYLTEADLIYELDRRLECELILLDIKDLKD